MPGDTTEDPRVFDFDVYHPGEHIDETQPLAPAWAYPKSKAAAEAGLREEHGHIPSVVLRLAGVYDAQTMVTTIVREIARIYQHALVRHL